MNSAPPRLENHNLGFRRALGPLHPRPPGMLLLLHCLGLVLLGSRSCCSPALLPRPIQAMESLFRDLGQFLEDDQEGTDNEQSFDYSVDFNQLPPNYHNEEHKERKVGNATIFSHRKIDKMTNNRTGEMVISRKTFTSIEEGDQGLMDRWKKNQEKERHHSDRLQALRRPLRTHQELVHPRLAFVMMQIPQTTRAKLPNTDMFLELKRELHRQSMAAEPTQQKLVPQAPALHEYQRSWPSLIGLLRRVFTFDR
uniref:Dickkopf-like protein 1 isoform X2 n=1 Tax=Geotrypetes seraphini TaxID=260995 RepID=A0A6P8SMV7_GEOSA|nr:dickkopf-like protein 1 isoform X2 [Geotrypetes seraphini]